MPGLQKTSNLRIQSPGHAKEDVRSVQRRDEVHSNVVCFPYQPLVAPELKLNVGLERSVPAQTQGKKAQKTRGENESVCCVWVSYRCTVKLLNDPIKRLRSLPFERKAINV